MKTNIPSDLHVSESGRVEPIWSMSSPHLGNTFRQYVRRAALCQRMVMLADMTNPFVVIETPPIIEFCDREMCKLLAEIDKRRRSAGGKWYVDPEGTLLEYDHMNRVIVLIMLLSKFEDLFSVESPYVHTRRGFTYVSKLARKEEERRNESEQL